MDREKLREETISIVRSCLMSVKDAVYIRQLARDYRKFTNAPIPYQQLGYESLEAFLSSVESLVVHTLPNGQVLVDALPDARSAHISDMVARQKPTKKRAPTRTMYPPRPTTHFQRWRPLSVVRATPRNEQHNQFALIREDLGIAAPRPLTPPRPPSNSNMHIEEYKLFLKQSRIAAQAKQMAMLEKENQAPAPNRSKERAPVLNGGEVRDVERLKAEGLAAVDAEAPLWNDWTSASSHSDGSSIDSEDDAGDFGETGNPVEDLKSFAKFRHLVEPCVTTLVRQSKPNRRLQYDCKIKVDGMIYSSYPADFHDAPSAIHYASKIALEKLIRKYGRTRKSLPITSDQHLLERLPPLIAKHDNGVWSWQVEADYKHLYREVLPSTWLKTIATNATITVEQFGDKFVLCESQPGNDSERLSCDVSVPTSVPAFDEEGYMTAKVTCPVSAGQFWCRQVGTAQAARYDDMMAHMNNCYERPAPVKQQREVKVDRVVQGHYYAAWDEGWHRVRVLEAGAEGALCLFIDRGDNMTVPLAEMNELHRQYAREPAQAFVCQLAGLADVYETTQFANAISEIDGAVVTLKVVRDNTDEENAQAQNTFTVVMYDADGNDKNKDLLIAIARETAEHCFEADKTFEVHVSHIPDEEQGEFYVQVHTPGFKVLMTLLQHLEQHLPRHVPSHCVTRDNSKGKTFFAKCPVDSRYHRVQLDFSSARVHLLQIDTGRTEAVNLLEVVLHPLEAVSLRDFPPQAQRMRMHLKEIPADLPTKMREMLAGGKVLLRVQEVVQGVPNVNLFVAQRTGLVSVNDSLSLEMYNRELSPEKKSPLKTEMLPSAGVLPAPRLPKSGEFFEVKIPFAVTPWNFFVQPLESANQLEDMMSALQEARAQAKTDPMNLKDIAPGRIYAARLRDGAWCRVAVMQAIHPTAILVFSVDYGYYASLSYLQLFPLGEEFLALPHQAIKAKLAGIKPVQNTWSVDDCGMFVKLVQRREFVGVVMRTDADELYPGDVVLVMKIIDTTSSMKDVLIEQLLIEKRIALKDNSC